MGIKISVCKKWDVKDDATYRLECESEVPEAADISRVAGELLGSMTKAFPKSTTSPPLLEGRCASVDYTIGRGRPPLRTIDASAPATSAQMKYLFKEAADLIRTDDKTAVEAYLKSAFCVSELGRITRGMAAEWFSGKRQE